VPDSGAPESLGNAENIADLLEEKTGYVIGSKVATSYLAVIEAMCTGKAHMGTLTTFVRSALPSPESEHL